MLKVISLLLIVAWIARKFSNSKLKRNPMSAQRARELSGRYSC